MAQAPALHLEGYGTHSFLLDNASLIADDGLGQEQTRKRRFWFGMRDAAPIDLRQWMEFAPLELPPARDSVGIRAEPSIACRGSRRHKRPPVGSGHDSSPSGFPRAQLRRPAVTGRHTSAGMGSAKPGNPGRYSIGEMLHLQGLPAEFLEHSPLSAVGKRKAIGNGVPQAMGRALARAVGEALARRSREGGQP